MNLKSGDLAIIVASREPSHIGNLVCVLQCFGDLGLPVYSVRSATLLWERRPWTWSYSFYFAEGELCALPGFEVIDLDRFIVKAARSNERLGEAA